MNHAHLTAVPPEPAGTGKDEEGRGKAVPSLPAPAAAGPHAARSLRVAGDSLISIADVRRIFGLGRTAGYELTRRPGFPDPVTLSAHCYRWWASEVDAFAAALRRERAQPTARRTAKPALPDPGATPRRITGNTRAARASRKQTS